MNKDSSRPLTTFGSSRTPARGGTRAPASRASTLRSRLREATADAILAATETTIAEQGVAAATMQSIAARAGVSVGTVYNHFRDRDELLRALFTARREQLIAELSTTLRRHARDPFRVQLQAFVDALFAQFDAHRAFLRVALDSEHARPGCVEDSPLHHVRALTAKIVRTGVKEGVLREEWTALYPAVLAGVMRGTLVAHLERDRPLVGASGAVIDLFLHGALLRPGPLPEERFRNLNRNLKS